MKEQQLRKIIRETILNESSKWKPLISKVAAACDYDYEECTEFIKELLVDINFYDEAIKVKKYMEKI